MGLDRIKKRMSQSNDTAMENVFEQMDRTVSLVTGARQQSLKCPLRIEIEFSGTLSEAMGSARNVADVVRDAGYTVETAHVTETEPLIEESDDERHVMEITVEE